jgi:hypothetical protein
MYILLGSCLSALTAKRIKLDKKEDFGECRVFNHLRSDYLLKILKGKVEQILPDSEADFLLKKLPEGSKLKRRLGNRLKPQVKSTLVDIKKNIQEAQFIIFDNNS